MRRAIFEMTISNVDTSLVVKIKRIVAALLKEKSTIGGIPDDVMPNSLRIERKRFLFIYGKFWTRLTI